VTGRFSWKLYRAYSSFYLVGTVLATYVPVVGWTPLKSLEQLAPCALFLGMHIIAICEVMKKRRKWNSYQTWFARIISFSIAGLVGASIIYLVAPTGYFGPLSARVRGLFVKHTRTGNPLVDSVAEHQPADSTAYWRYLHFSMYTSPVGFFLVLFLYFDDSSSFLVVYGIAAYFFSGKMVRLILLTAPVSSALSGVILGRLLYFCWSAFIPVDPQLTHIFGRVVRTTSVILQEAVPVTVGDKDEVKAKATMITPVTPTDKKSTPTNDEKEEKLNKSKTKKPAYKIYFYYIFKVTQVIISIALLQKSKPYILDFHNYCWDMSKGMSHPTIIVKAETRDGEIIKIDDYRHAYLWLKKNTPEDSRILAWWDYGYQITGIGNRTTLADGNTWNHEHIALIGRILTGPEKESHRIARHIADYVLIWAGGGGDDLAKSPHLARIANSVYRGICPDGPACTTFGMQQSREGVIPTPMMERSLLYKLHSNGRDGVEVDRNRQVLYCSMK
jgi:dolichyl-diphosphooligosaccharide--protein glycosyltransferase